MQSNVVPSVYSVVETARILGISRSHTYELIHQGVIPSVRLGRRIVVPHDGLMELLTTGTVVGRTPSAA